MFAPAGTPPLIAVLDDEQSVRLSLRRLLRVHGFDVLLCANGPSLLDAQAAQAVACILLDLNMPGMDGYEVLRRLAATPRPPPVIVITGQYPNDGASQVIQLGACACLAKPIDQDTLLAAIQAALHTGPQAG